MHIGYRVLHNDLKGDNVVLKPTLSAIGAVIIDLGKACEIDEGKWYHLTKQEKEKYKLHHPQIAPDLRDGLCKQSEATDVYSFGRMMNMMITNANIQSQAVKSLSEQCMQYDGCLRPETVLLQQVLQV